MTKPFSPREVVLRVHSILRRTRAVDSEEEAASHAGGEPAIDDRHHQVMAHGEPVELTATEWRLLTTLAAAPRRVFSRYELINRIRGYEFEGYERTVDSHVRNLRHKIEKDRRSPELIETVIGIGYRLAATRDTTPRPSAPLD